MTLKFPQPDNLNIINNPRQRIIEIEGIRYTYDFFKAFGCQGMRFNTPFIITERKDGAVTVEEWGK